METKVLFVWFCCLNKEKRKDRKMMENISKQDYANDFIFHRDLYNFSYARAWAVCQGLVFIRHESRKNV
jgi:hypothetical protein